jgi:hypothetical protein
MIKVCIIVLSIIFISPAAFAQQNRWKSYKTAGSSIGMSAYAAETITITYSYVFDEEQEKAGVKVRSYVDKSTDDYIHLGTRNGKVMIVVFDAGNSDDKENIYQTNFYNKFEKEILKENFRLKSSETDKDGMVTKLFTHPSKGQNIQVILFMDETEVELVQVSIYTSDFDPASFEDEDAEPETKKDPYDFTNVQDLADVLNKNMKYGRLNVASPYYFFYVMGKIEKQQASVEFFVRSNALYLRMNLNSTDCNSGITEIKAEFAGGGGSALLENKAYLPATFNFNYQCKGVTYKQLYLHFDYLSKTFEEKVIEKLKACCPVEMPKKPLYDLSTMQGLANALNTFLYAADINSRDPVRIYREGSTDNKKSAIEFFIKNNALFIRLTPGKNFCDPGTREIKAEFNKAQGVMSSGGIGYFGLSFYYRKTCNDKTYRNLQMYFKHLHYEFQIELAEKLKETSAWPRPRGFSSNQELADILNKSMKYGRINNGSKAAYNFAVLGKIAKNKRSIMFIVKNKELYFRINTPPTDCSSGLQEIPVSYDDVMGTSTKDGSGKFYMYLKMKHKYSCMDYEYNGMYLYFDNISVTMEERISEAMTACCYNIYDDLLW